MSLHDYHEYFLKIRGVFFMFNTEFLITSLIVVLIPGTGVIYTVSNGLFLGWRASIAAAIGCTAGIIPHLAASILGLSAILHMSAMAFQVIKFAGAAYLLYLAWSMWRENGPLNFNSPKVKNNFRQIITKGFLINILNPKLSIFFLAFLPLFVSPTGASPSLQMLALSGVFMALTLIVFIFYGLSANGVRSYITHSPKITSMLQRMFAATFAVLGIKLAMTDQ
jgi:threonine/homoserine/homoserine lactone efflux protein